MPITTLDPGTALVVVDLQTRIAFLPTVAPSAKIARAASTLADSFRSRGLPVVLVKVAAKLPESPEHGSLAGALPAGFGGFLLELKPHYGDYVVSRQTAGTFIETGLGIFLTSIGITQVVIAGVATSMGVASTAREAAELGFKVTLAVDAMTDFDAGLQAITVAKVFPGLGETGKVAEVLCLLAMQNGVRSRESR